MDRPSRCWNVACILTWYASLRNYDSLSAYILSLIARSIPLDGPTERSGLPDWFPFYWMDVYFDDASLLAFLELICNVHFRICVDLIIMPFIRRLRRLLCIVFFICVSVVSLVAVIFILSSTPALHEPLYMELALCRETLLSGNAEHCTLRHNDTISASVLNHWLIATDAECVTVGDGSPNSVDSVMLDSNGNVYYVLTTESALSRPIIVSHREMSHFLDRFAQEEDTRVPGGYLCLCPSLLNLRQNIVFHRSGDEWLALYWPRLSHHTVESREVRSRLVYRPESLLYPRSQSIASRYNFSALQHHDSFVITYLEPTLTFNAWKDSAVKEHTDGRNRLTMTTHLQSGLAIYVSRVYLRVAHSPMMTPYVSHIV